MGCQPGLGIRVFLQNDLLEIVRFVKAYNHIHPDL